VGLSARTAHRLRFAALYFCEGAPIGFLWWALPTLLRRREVPVDRIGALVSWLVLPWALKFLWAPLIDARGPARLPRWITGAQLVMAATLLPAAWLDPVRHFGWLAAALVAHAVAAASQDAAIDSLALGSTPPREQGSLNGWMQAGMLLGRSAFGGGALVAVDWLGERALVHGLAGMLVVAALGLARVHRPGPEVAPAAGERPRASLGAHLRAALRSRVTWLGLVFAATSGAGFEVVGALAGPMLDDHGAATRTIGVFFALVAVAANALGALAGGRAADRLGVRRTVLGSGVLVAAIVLSMAALLRVGCEPTTLLVALGFLYVGIGAFTASSYALFMRLTDPALGATQFSAYMGATNLCESWSARLGSTLAARSGYASAFAWPAVVALLSLPLLRALRTRSSSSEP